MLLCKHSLLQLCPNAPVQYIEKYFDNFGIDDVDQQINFLAQVIHESGHFNHTIENLNYSAKGLAATWPSRFANKDKTPNDTALSIARKPQLIANAVYNGRMGNASDSNDGWNYRGRGYLQLTGKSNYQSIGKYLYDRGIIDDANLFIDQPDLVATPQYATLTAVAYWVRNNCWAKRDDIKYITKKINGGLIGLADREAIGEKLFQGMT